MILLASQPRLADLHHLINDIRSYPISIRRLLGLASRKQVAPEVIDFYKNFPENIIFKDRDDLLARTEQVEILRRENQPEEDVVRGAED